MKHPPPVVGTLVAALRSEWRGHTSETNGLLNSPSQWTTLDTIYISQCKEGVRVLVFLATILYGTLAFFMEVKERP